MIIEKHVRIAYALLIPCAALRLMLQMAALPPYAGLDESWHVARLAFVRAEGRQPMIGEKSIPPYVAASIAQRAGAMPSFCDNGPRWPEIVRTRPVLVDAPMVVRPYESPNYEAQQPSLYYALAARLVPARSAMFELRCWRGLSLLFALACVVAAAEIGRRWLGPIGILGGALLVALPTWLTLVVRASNDALACALIAAGFAVSLRGAPAPSAGPLAGRRNALFAAGEALLWAAACATKLYAWPMLVPLAYLLWRQRPSRARVAVIAFACALAIGGTALDLSHRTRNPLGDFGFDAPQHVSAPQRIDVVTMLKTTVASMVWTSGQHWDALKPVGMAFYALPLILAMTLWSGRLQSAGGGTGSGGLKPRIVAGVAIIAFGVAQFVNAAAFIRQARAAGLALPLGGKEGWYWYSLAPLAIPALLLPAVRRFRLTAWWVVGWDVLINDAQLFHDFAGSASPAHPSLLFRWGPLHPPFSAQLAAVAIGPLAAHAAALRVVQLVLFFGLESFLQRSSSDDRNPFDRSAEPARSR
jgi:hypothetical protein